MRLPLTDEYKEIFIKGVNHKDSEALRTVLDLKTKFKRICCMSFEGDVLVGRCLVYRLTKNSPYYFGYVDCCSGVLESLLDKTGLDNIIGPVDLFDIGKIGSTEKKGTLIYDSLYLRYNREQMHKYDGEYNFMKNKGGKFGKEKFRKIKVSDYVSNRKYTDNGIRFKPQFNSFYNKLFEEYAEKSKELKDMVIYYFELGGNKGYVLGYNRECFEVKEISGTYDMCKRVVLGYFLHDMLKKGKDVIWDVRFDSESNNPAFRYPTPINLPYTMKLEGHYVSEYVKGL